MKALLFCFLLLLNLPLHARQIDLNFLPRKPIIQFNFEGITIYTDTASIFSSYKSENKNPGYHLRIRNLVLSKIKAATNDTIIFTGNFVPFNDSLNEYVNNWYIDWIIISLTERKMLKIFDKSQNEVMKISVKKIGSKKKGHIRRAYINKYTGDELFYSTLYIRIVNLPF